MKTLLLGLLVMAMSSAQASLFICEGDLTDMKAYFQANLHNCYLSQEEGCLSTIQANIVNSSTAGTSEVSNDMILNYFGSTGDTDIYAFKGVYNLEGKAYRIEITDEIAISQYGKFKLYGFISPLDGSSNPEQFTCIAQYLI